MQLPYFWLIGGTTLYASLPFVFERVCKSWSKLEELRVTEALKEQEQNCQIAESKAQNAEYKMSRKYLADQGQDGSNSESMEMLKELIALKPLVDKNREEIAKIAYFRKALTNGNNTANQGVCRGYMNRVSYLQGLVANNMKEIKHVMDKLTAKKLVPANHKVFQFYLDQEEGLMAQQHEMFEKDRRERCSLVPCFPCLSGVVGSSGVAPASTSSAGPGPALASPVVGSSGVARACTSSGGPRPAAPASPLPCAAGPGAEAPARDLKEAIVVPIPSKALVKKNQKVFQSYLDQEEELMAQQHEMFEKDRGERCSLVPCFPCLSGMVAWSGVAPASTSSAGPGPVPASPVVGSSGVTSSWEMQMQGE